MDHLSVNFETGGQEAAARGAGVPGLIGEQRFLMVLLLLALVGHSELRMDSRHWDFYLGKLRLATMNWLLTQTCSWQFLFVTNKNRDRKCTQMKRPYAYETIEEAIAISFGQLDETTRQMLDDFVIFEDDVNIPAAVSGVNSYLFIWSRYFTNYLSTTVLSETQKN